MGITGQASDTASNTARAGLKTWLSDLGLDTAKLGLLLYLLGLLASGFYYSRFSILTLDLAKIQCILVGIYVVGFYATAPAVTLLAGKGITNGGIVSMLLAGVLGPLDLLCGWLAGYRGLSLINVSLLTVVLQFLLFLDFASLLRSVFSRGMQIAFILPPPRVKTAVFALLFCFHFSLVWFPQIPAYFGGGKPLSVQVFTKTPDLPANRFFVSRNQPRINKSMDSFSLRLLYETDKDAYFVNDLEAGDILIGYSVMRIKKDEIIRIDYNTPKWVIWKGGQ